MRALDFSALPGRRLRPGNPHRPRAPARASRQLEPPARPRPHLDGRCESPGRHPERAEEALQARSTPSRPRARAPCRSLSRISSSSYEPLFRSILPDLGRWARLRAPRDHDRPLRPRRAWSGAFKAPSRGTSKSITGREQGISGKPPGSDALGGRFPRRGGLQASWRGLETASPPGLAPARRAVPSLVYLHHHMSPCFEASCLTRRFNAPDLTISPDSQPFATCSQVIAPRALDAWGVKTKGPERAGFSPTEAVETGASRGFPHPRPPLPALRALLC